MEKNIIKKIIWVPLGELLNTSPKYFLYGRLIKLTFTFTFPFWLRSFVVPSTDIYIISAVFFLYQSA